MDGFKNKGFVRTAAVLVLVLLLVPVLLLGVYDRPSADDHDYAIHTHAAVEAEGGLSELFSASVATVSQFYEEWQGTYTSAFFMSLQPGIFGETYYGLSPVIFVGIIFLCSLGIASVVCRRLAGLPGFWPTLLLGLLLTVVITLSMPSPVQGLYWFNGAMHYIPWTMLTFLNAALLLEIALCKKPGRRIWLTAAVSLSSLLISGGNPATGFLNLLVLGLGLLLMPGKKRLWVALALVFALAGYAVMFVAPGNAVRQSRFVRPGVVKTLVYSFIYCWQTIARWVNLPYLCLLAVFTPLSLRIVTQFRGRFQFRMPLVPVLVSGVLLCGTLAVPYFGTGDFGAGRFMNAVWIAFLLLTLADWTWFLGWLDRRDLPSRVAETLRSGWDRRAAALGLVLAMGFSCVLSAGNPGKLSTAAEAANELLDGSAAAHAAEMDQRFAQLHDAAVTDPVFAPLESFPELLYFSELDTDATQWPNTSCALYYGKNSVCIYGAEE